MSKWSEMSAREWDAWVAEHVMGWNKNVWRTGGWYTNPGFVKQIPKFTTDAASDYLVLCKVREEWCADSEQFCEFCEYLNQLQSNRARSYTSRGYSYSGANYQPGDYAHAAFLTLEGA